MQHVLSSIIVVGVVEKGVKAEAEVLVWKQIDQAKMFLRALGEWYARSTSRALTEKELRSLAGRFELDLTEKKGLVTMVEDEDDVEWLKTERASSGSMDGGSLVLA